MDPHQETPDSDLQAVQELSRAYESMRSELAKAVVGQADVIEQVLTAMLCRGHCPLVKYPTPDEELLVMKHASSDYRPELSRLLDGQRIATLQDVVRRVPVAEHLFEYARDLAHATRPGEAGAPTYIREWVQWGAGP